jgi:hypothetical protein
MTKTHEITLDAIILEWHMGDENVARKMFADVIDRRAVIEAVRSVPAGTTRRGPCIIEAINALPSLESVNALVKRILDGLWPVLGGPRISAKQWTEVGEVVRTALSAFDKE